MLKIMRLMMKVSLISLSGVLLATAMTTNASASKKRTTIDNQTIVDTSQLTTATNQNATNNNNNGQTTTTNQSTNPTNQTSSTNGVKIKLHPTAISGYHALYRQAAKHLGLPYVYGGTTASGFDCSGFTKYVYQHSLGMTLPRTAQAQYDAGVPVDEAHAKAGDLVFFGASTNQISHVGIYLGHGKMIDSQNRGVVKERIHASYWHLVGFASVTGD